MIIRPKQKLKNLFFYNNLIFIVVIFSIICFLTSMNLQNSKISSRTDDYVKEGQIYGPIKITNDPKIYKINVYFSGDDSSSYISGEVLDEDKDTLYEFGKDLWHEQGYDSDGHWSESERNMTTYLTFRDKGIYYIQFNTEENSMDNISISISQMRGSYVFFSEIGSIALILVLLIFSILNRRWLIDKCAEINEKLEEMSEDD